MGATGSGQVAAFAEYNGYIYAATQGQGQVFRMPAPASGTTYEVAGTVLTDAGQGLEGVTISTGSSGVETDASGNYSVTGLLAGTYTLTPTLNGYSFTPPIRAV